MFIDGAMDMCNRFLLDQCYLLNSKVYLITVEVPVPIRHNHPLRPTALATNFPYLQLSLLW